MTTLKMSSLWTLFQICKTPVKCLKLKVRITTTVHGRKNSSFITRFYFRSSTFQIFFVNDGFKKSKSSLKNFSDNNTLHETQFT